MITLFEALNFWAALLALLVMISMIAYALTYTQRHHALSPSKYPSVFASFLLFGANYLFGVLLGLTFVLGSRPSPQVSYFLHVFLNNIGSFCVFLSAAAYAGGNGFIWKNGILGGFVSVVVFLVWAVVGSLAVGNSYATLIVFAPVALLSAAAYVSLGWAFFARWHGIDGLIFFLITIAYSLIEMAGFLTFVSGSDAVASEIATALVFMPRVLLAFAFISLACSSDNPAIKMDESKYWPGATVKPRYPVTSLYGIITAIATTIPATISVGEKVVSLCPTLGIPGLCR